MNEAELSAALNRLLEESGFSAWELSRRANVKFALVSAALQGSPSVPVRAWCRLARALQREVELAPGRPFVRIVGPVESFVDIALRRIGEPNSLNTEPTEPGDDLPIDVQFIELYDMAKATFDSAEEAAAWLRRPHPMLKGESPLKCARSRAGVQRVIGVLLAIKEGGVV